jgi:hypothetical protein
MVRLERAICINTMSRVMVRPKHLTMTERRFDLIGKRSKPIPIGYQSARRIGTRVPWLDSLIRDELCEIRRLRDRYELGQTKLSNMCDPE